MAPVGGICRCSKHPELWISDPCAEGQTQMGNELLPSQISKAESISMTSERFICWGRPRRVC